jgi:hypothetical protein
LLHLSSLANIYSAAGGDLLKRQQIATPACFHLNVTTGCVDCQGSGIAH